MNEEQEQVLVINVNLTRGLAVLLILAMLILALLVSLAWGQKEVAASGSQAPLSASTTMRQYYLSGPVLNATYALTVCVAGYHMASLWELLDTSNLEYNATLGHYQGDSRPGPPTASQGWVRTGYSGSTVNTAGIANCNAWTGTSGYGTTAGLPSNWTAGTQAIHVWAVGTSACGSPADVWCVED